MHQRADQQKFLFRMSHIAAPPLSRNSPETRAARRFMAKSKNQRKVAENAQENWRIYPCS
jgi:hypothetical protein